MSVADWLTPIAAFLGAGIGSWLVYRSSARDQRRRRLEAALDLLASQEPRRRALGRARVVPVVLYGGSPDADRLEALAVLREDVRAACTPDVLGDLARQLEDGANRTRIAEEVSEPRVTGDEVLVSPSLVESALAYVQISGGVDAAEDQLVALIAQAKAQAVRLPIADALAQTQARVPSHRPLPSDQRLLIIKLSVDAARLSQEKLRERTRAAWRISLDRLTDHAPVAVVAVIQQEVRGAWLFLGATRSDEDPDRVEFTLGDAVPDLIGCAFLDTGQNPVRYWP